MMEYMTEAKQDGPLFRGWPPRELALDKCQKTVGGGQPERVFWLVWVRVPAEVRLGVSP